MTIAELISALTAKLETLPPDTIVRISSEDGWMPVTLGGSGSGWLELEGDWDAYMKEESRTKIETKRIPPPAYDLNSRETTTLWGKSLVSGRTFMIGRKAYDLAFGTSAPVADGTSPKLEPNPALRVSIEIENGLGQKKVLWDSEDDKGSGEPE